MALGHAHAHTDDEMGYPAVMKGERSVESWDVGAPRCTEGSGGSQGGWEQWVWAWDAGFGTK